MKLFRSLIRNRRSSYFQGVAVLLALLFPLMNVGYVFADVPGRTPPRGTVPDPGTQQQELPNITFPAPYNVFEFPGTCMACHGGTIDQTAGHGGNWAGSNMASAARDPIFRANQIIVNNTIKNMPGGSNGAGNQCFRCHAPNAWLSGRADPTLGGAADGSDMIQSILLSTDNEGVNCEQCHRAIGAVKMKPIDINPLTGSSLYDPNDPVWNMVAGPAGEWTHAGDPYPLGPAADNPYGNATLQYHDGMSYGAKYGGNVETFFSDVPDFIDPITGALIPSHYTGQTYGVYPDFFTGYIQPAPPDLPVTNSLGQVIQYNPDGSTSFVQETGVTPDALWGAISPEHSTRENLFVKSSEFCGSCHDVTMNIMNKGTPGWRTYTEWKYSSFGSNGTRCQDCHMPTMKHEYTDAAPVSLNPDPVLAGWYPYAKDRNPYGGTSFHKFAGANRDLPMMMKVLYPEIDLELVGAPTGHDPLIFPGMFSDRGPMWDRAMRNSEISLRDGVSVQITEGPTYVSGAGNNALWRVKVKVTNNTGHKVPSGFGDGRRMWISLVVKSANGTIRYQSGNYNPATATLSNSASTTTLTRAQTNVIDSTVANTVMIYEKRTGTANAGGGTFRMSPSLLNEKILFDNRIPPAGFTGADYSLNGAGFWNYTGTELAATPVEDPTRYPDGQNFDEVTYIFNAPQTANLSARAELNYQSQSREFMEYLKDTINAFGPLDKGPRPEGPPNPMAANYPLTPTYLSDSIMVTTGANFATMTDLANNPLQDHWGGIAYAAWLLTGKGAPYVMAADDTAVAGPPAAPAAPTVSYIVDPATGVNDPNLQRIAWSSVTGADGYLVWVRYGASDLTSSWDRLAVQSGNANTSLDHVGLNPGKTFVYGVQAFNAKGLSDMSVATAAQTPAGLPLPPLNTKVTGVTSTTVTLAWFDEADNETGFIIQRQQVLAGGALGPWVTVGNTPSQTPGPGTGGNSWTDNTGLTPNTTYNYQVAAYNAAGPSVFDLPVSATTSGTPPTAPSNLTAAASVVGNAVQITLNWADNSNNELSFVVQRSTDPKRVPFTDQATVGQDIRTFVDPNVTENTTYYYRVYALNNAGASGFSNTASAKTPVPPPAAPTDLNVTVVTPNSVTLEWLDASTNETGFEIWMQEPNKAFKRIATVGAGVTTYTPTRLTAGTTYLFEVRAVNSGGASPFAGPVAGVTTP